MSEDANFHFINGVSLKLDEQFSEAIKELETAISLGIPHKDEMKARYFLGQSYMRVTNPDLHTEQLINSHEFIQTTTQMEKAVKMDAEKGYQFFVENRSFLVSLDVYYALMGSVIQETQGEDAVINYYERKLNLFNYLPTQPMLRVLLQLGVLYAKTKNDEENARRCFLAIVNAEPVNPEDEIDIRRMAEHNLSLSEAETETPAKSGCFIATAVYEETSPELHFFRFFRDEFLLKSIAGKVFVRVYYSFSPHIAKWLKKSNYAKQFVKVILLKPFLYLIKFGVRETKSTPKNY